MHIMLFAVPGHRESFGEDTCQSVTFDLSILRTIIEFPDVVFARCERQRENKSCFARLKCNSCSKGTKFHSLSDTWSLQTLQILLKCRPNLIPKLPSQGWTSSPQPNIQKSQWDASWKWIGLNWDFVQQGHRQSQIKPRDVAELGVRKLGSQKSSNLHWLFMKVSPKIKLVQLVLAGARSWQLTNEFQLNLPRTDAFSCSRYWHSGFSNMGCGGRGRWSGTTPHLKPVLTPSLWRHVLPSPLAEYIGKPWHLAIRREIWGNRSGK